MRILAIDTSSMVSAVAIIDDEKLLGEYSINNKRNHSERLLPMVKELMDTLELSPESIDVYAVATGPGSFTGLRIAVTTIKTIAYASKKPTMGISTLDALAYSALPFHSNAYICPMVDARNNQVYTSLYRPQDGSILKASDYAALDINELANKLCELDAPVVLIGDATPNHQAFFETALGEKCIISPVSLLNRTASSVALLALQNARNGRVESCFDTVPYYLRKSQAERLHKS